MAFVWPQEHEAHRGEGTCPAPSLSPSVEDTCCPHSGDGAPGGQQSRSLASPTPERASQDARRPGRARRARARCGEPGQSRGHCSRPRIFLDSTVSRV